MKRLRHPVRSIREPVAIISSIVAISGLSLALLLALLPASASALTTRLQLPFSPITGSGTNVTLHFPSGVAVDETSANLFLNDGRSGNVTDIFGADGAAPIGVASPFQLTGFSFGGEPSGAAIDNAGTSPSKGALYVVDPGAGKVEKFVLDGATELYEAAGELTATSPALHEPLGDAVDSKGDVFVADYGSSSVVEFDPTGAQIGRIGTSGSVGRPSSVALDDAGDLFVQGYGNGSVYKYPANGSGEVEEAVFSQVVPGAATGVAVDTVTNSLFIALGNHVSQYDATTLAPQLEFGAGALKSSARLAVNSTSGDVYVADPGRAVVAAFGPAVKVPGVTVAAATAVGSGRATLNGTVNPDELAIERCEFEYGLTTGYGNSAPCEGATPADADAHPVAGVVTGLDPETTYHFRVVAANANGAGESGDQTFTTGEVVSTSAATAVNGTEATLNGVVSPEGAAVTGCRFEYGLTSAYGSTVPCAESQASIGEGTGPVDVHADLKGLARGTTYHYRLAGTTVQGVAKGADESFQASGAVIRTEWAATVVGSEATLKATIDPEGSATTYRFEYGADSSYGHSTREAAVGADEADHTVTQLLESLTPGATYHYRVVATNSVGTSEGPDQTFTTYSPFIPETNCPNQAFRIGPAANLPDCRAYEMVSPVEKGGGDIMGVNDLSFFRSSYDKSAASGEKITYSSGVSFGDEVSSQSSNQYLATRGPAGWSTTGINAPVGKDLFFPEISPFVAAKPPFMGFTEDLSTAWLVNETPIDSNGLKGFLNLYKRDDGNGGLEPVTVGEPTSFGFAPSLEEEFKGASADGSRTVFSAAAALTPDAAAGGNRQIYESSGGVLRLVSILPDGTADSETSNVGTHNGISQERTGNEYRAVSRDGSRIFWTSGGDSNGFISGSGGKIYLRENATQPQSALSGGRCTEPAKACTIPVSETVTSSNAHFLTAAGDGSGAIFRIDEGPQQGDLYRFDVETETSTLIAHHSYGIAGAGEDLSYVYFASSDVLAAGATAGEPNLYLDHEGAEAFIGTLSAAELARASEVTQLGEGTSAAIAASPIQTASRVTPDGRHIVFQSAARLTSYDNTDSGNGEPATEVYLYDADTRHLTCVSCNPSGARPEAKELRAAYAAGIEGSLLKTGTTAAAWIPTWEHPLDPSRLLSADGNRVFFNSYDALTPRDTNGKQDVYEWEAQGAGTCRTAAGCLSLISSGESAKSSEFVDASADGRDVFIRTESSFDRRDPGLLDIYDARVDGGFAIPPSPPPCVGDACQSIPAPPNDPTPASAGFDGAGNQVAPRKAHHNCRARNRRAGKGNKAKQKLTKGCVRAKGKAKRHGHGKAKKHARGGAKK